MQEHAATLDVAEEARAQPRPLVGALDQPRDIGQHEVARRRAHHAEVGVERREGVVGDLGLGRAHGRQEGGLAGIGETDDAGVGDQLEPEPDGHLLARLAGVGAARRLIGRGLEMRIAEAAVAAPGDARALAGLDQLRQHRLLVLGQHLGAGGQLDHQVLPGRAGAVLAHAAATALGLEMLAEAIVDQRVEVGDARNPHVAALAAVAAVGPAELDEFLAPEGDAAVAAVAGAHIDLGLVEELHLPRASNAERVSFVLTCGKSPPRGLEYKVVSPSREKPSFSCTRNDAALSANAPE